MPIGRMRSSAFTERIGSEGVRGLVWVVLFVEPERIFTPFRGSVVVDVSFFFLLFKFAPCFLLLGVAGFVDRASRKEGDMRRCVVLFLFYAVVRCWEVCVVPGCVRGCPFPREIRSEMK